MANVSRPYVTVQMPVPLMEMVDKIVENRSNGYRSRNEFCVDSVRKWVRKFKKQSTPTNKNNNDGGEDGSSS